ncbi:hypothetical protein GGQ84_000876 [Desulfitispora alkaliphila]|uniref:S-layer homology domain-containing protein n=1 Tax=Desulfitispora alkaliphila TaxID=622674 RepID=UPI003D1DFD13
MKKHRKIIALLMALAFVFSLAMPAAMAAQEDLAEVEEVSVAATKLNALDIIEGYPDGTYGENQTITRAEFAAIAVRALGLASVENAARGNTMFPDVNPDGWYTGWINLAVNEEIINGYPDGTFKPNEPVTYAEALTMLVRMAGYEPSVRGSWPTSHLAKAAEIGLTSGVQFNHRDAALRGDVFRFVDETLEVDLMEAFTYEATGRTEYRTTDKNLLTERHDLEIVEGLVTEIPRVGNLEDDEIEIFGEEDFANDGFVTYEVVADIDFEAFFGIRVKAYYNDDDQIVTMAPAPKGSLYFDAVEWDAAEEELVLMDLDNEFELHEDAIVYLNGELSSFGNTTVEYDYAKVVTNRRGYVVFVDAYQWDDFIVVEELDGYDVYGYGEELDLDDFVVVKDGRTLDLSDIVPGDIVFYNNNAEYAEVFNSTVVGEIEYIFNTEFEVAGETFDYDNADFGTSGINVKYVDEDGDIDNFTSDEAEKMQDEGDVVVFLDRKGNAVFVDGELGVLETSTLALFLTEDLSGYFDVRERGYLLVEGVNENGVEIEYDFRLNNLDKITVYGDTEVEVGDDITPGVEEVDKFVFTDGSDTEVTTNGAIDSIGFKGDVSTVTDILALSTYAAANDVVLELTFDENGNVVELAFYDASRWALTTEDLELDDRFVTATNDYRLSSSTPVFNLDRYTDDADDIVVTTWGALEGFGVDDGDAKVFFDADGYVDYLVILQTDTEDVTDYTGVISQIRNDSDGDLARIRAFIDGSEETLYIDQDKYTETNAPVLGQAFTITVDDATGRVLEIANANTNSPVIVDTNQVSTVDRTINNGLYKLDRSGVVYDVTDPTDIEVIPFRDLRSLDSDNEVTVVFESANTSYFLEAILVTKDGEAGTGGAGVDTYELKDLQLVNSDADVQVTIEEENVPSGTDFVAQLIQDGNHVAYVTFDDTDFASNEFDIVFSGAGDTGSFTVRVFKANDPDTILDQISKFLVD